MRVLLVDDEVELVSTLAERLRMRGIEADWTPSAAGALTAVKERDYAIAVLNVKLPGTTGLELRTRLHLMCPTMKFIFVTGHGCEDAFEQGQEAAGSEYYLVKPVNIGLLVQKIHDALEQEAP